LFALVLVVIAVRDPALWWLLILLVLDLFWVIRIFEKDRDELRKESAGDQGLAGAPNEWFPNAPPPTS
jgi:hypothetical protein